MQEEAIDAQVVINSLAQQITRLTTEMAVKDAIIESYRAKLQIEVQPVEDDIEES